MSKGRSANSSPSLLQNSNSKKKGWQESGEYHWLTPICTLNLFLFNKITEKANLESIKQWVRWWLSCQNWLVPSGLVQTSEAPTSWIWCKLPHSLALGLTEEQTWTMRAKKFHSPAMNRSDLHISAMGGQRATTTPGSGKPSTAFLPTRKLILEPLWKSPKEAEEVVAQFLYTLCLFSSYLNNISPSFWAAQGAWDESVEDNQGLSDISPAADWRPREAKCGKYTGLYTNTGIGQRYRRKCFKSHISIGLPH